MTDQNDWTPTELDEAMGSLAAWRGAKFDQQDKVFWGQALEEHNHSGLTTEAAERFGRDDSLQDTPLTLAAFLRVVKEIRGERIADLKDRFPQPPSGITDEQYRTWVRVCNECAVRKVSPDSIDAAARRAIHAPPRPAISDRPAPVLYLPPSPSA